jgi:YVTN family beta-propeller protein
LYATNNGSGSVSKINLASSKVSSTIKVGSGPKGIAITPNGAFFLVVNGTDQTISKVAITEKESQSITFDAVADVWIGKKSVLLPVSSSSGLTVAITSSSPTVCTVDGLAVQLVGVGTCALSADQAGDADWLAASKVEKSFKVTNQIITFAALPDVLLSAGRVTVSASATSTLPVVFASSTPSVCEVAGSTVTLVSFGACTISANQDGGGTDKAAEVRLTFQVLADPGVSILDSLAYTNTKAVTLNLVWPRGATEARISNDGGFSRSKTTTVPLSAVVNWKLDDSRAGAYTKIVYVRFNGTGLDTTKTYTDDIILDTAAPDLLGLDATLSSVDPGAVSISSLQVKKTNGVKVVVRAYDRLSGIGFIEVRSKPTGKLTKIKSSQPKAKSQIVRVRTVAKRLQIRVVDRAGNRSGWRYVSVK